MDAELVGQEMIHELELTTNVYEKMAELLKKIDSLVSFSSDDKKLIRGAILRKAQEMLDRLNG